MGVPPSKPEAVTDTDTESVTDTETEAPEGAEVVAAYNATFGTRLGLTPGNLKAARRALSEGYSVDAMREVFEAVRDGTTSTAAWCAKNNREFEYLVRPPYKHRETREMVHGPLDRIPNEIATGRRAG